MRLIWRAIGWGWTLIAALATLTIVGYIAAAIWLGVAFMLNGNHAG